MVRRITLAIALCAIVTATVLVAGQDVRFRPVLAEVDEPPEPGGTTETFTDTAGDDLGTQHAGQLGAWTEHPVASGGSVVITDANRARLNTANANELYYSAYVPAANTYDVEYDIRCESLIAGHYYSLYGRLNTTVLGGYYVMFDTSAGQLRLYQSGGAGGTSGGLDVMLGSAFAFAPTLNTSYTIRMELRATTVTIYLDKSPIITATNSTVTAVGRGGFGGYATAPAPANNAGCHVDNFTMTDFVAGPTYYFLTNYTPTSSSNGWGPIEEDTSNGENGTGDGTTITLNGVQYAKGLGTHAASSVTYNLGGGCSAFHAVIGVDDEVGSSGSVVFSVVVQGVTQYTSSPLTGTSLSETIMVPVTGAMTLQLLVSDAGNGNSFDHGDWADAKVNCTTEPPSTLGFTKTDIATGLDRPTAMVITPNADGRIFVAQQGGALRVISDEGTLLTTPMHTFTVDSAGERGLIGVTIDPSFTSNNYIYVYYTSTSGGAHNRVSRITASGDVSTGSETVLMDFPNLSAEVDHNGGALHFGTDGKLYIAIGDNKNSANSQTNTTVLGKMLRINSDGTIPTDNPFYGSTSGNNRAIWALGLRNPFTFAFHPDGTYFFINDVGENLWEEINNGVAGANYGWPNSEGFTSTPGETTPRYYYSLAGPECAIAGGAFYDPTTATFPAEYLNDYFFADFCAGWIKKLDPTDNSVTTFDTGLLRPVDLRVAQWGSLYYLTRGTGGATGGVGRWHYGTGGGPTGGGAGWHGSGTITDLTKPSGSIDVNPSETGGTIQAAINAAASNATLWIKAGTHRFQQFTPKTGQTIVGEPGSIINGSRVLTSPNGSGPWYYTGQTDTLVWNNPSYFCQSGTPSSDRCGFPNDVFIDGYPQDQVVSTTPGTGQFYYDYDADRIYIGTNPSGKVVEVSVTQTAVPHSDNTFTLKNLTIRQYATPTDGHCVTIRAGSIIQNSVVSGCHYGGITNATGGDAIKNIVEWNGAQAFGGGGGGGVLIEDNEVRYNNYARYDAWWGAGGSKWVHADGLIVRGNWSHHNSGPGFWTDINNINVLYENNLLEDNRRAGIFHEISYDAVMRNNIIRRNGSRPGDGSGGAMGATWPVYYSYYGFPTECGISNLNSRNVEIYGNILEENSCGVGIYTDCRIGPPSQVGVGATCGGAFNDASYGNTHGYWQSSGNYIHDNIIRQTQTFPNPGRTGLMYSDIDNTGGMGPPEHDPRTDIRFEYNHYTLGSQSGYFYWNDGVDGIVNDAEWQALSNTVGEIIDPH